MENRSSAKSFFIGLFTGGAIGGLAALLYAPKSGKELRKDIKKKGREVAKDTGDYIENAKNKASEIIYDGRQKTEEILREAKEKAEGLLSQSRDFVSEESAKIKDAFKAGVDSFKDERKQRKIH
jgi:gas vesicle protein